MVSSDSPEISGKGETSDILGLPAGEYILTLHLIECLVNKVAYGRMSSWYYRSVVR